MAFTNATSILAMTHMMGRDDKLQSEELTQRTYDQFHPRRRMIVKKLAEQSRFVILATLIVAVSASCTSQQTNRPSLSGPMDEFARIESSVDPYVPYVERRAAHRTRQIGTGPIEGVAMLPAPPGVELVSYFSNGLELKGWLVKPKAASNQPRPGVVYLHNNFSLTMRSYDNALAFVEAGFTVFLPTWRAENGNAGDFELLYGEVDDAKAAIAWFAARPDILPDAVYVIGHSIGGGIAALLSLHPDQQARITASVGGIYRARTFWFWSNRSSTHNLIRFDPLDATEVTLRLLGPNVRDMANRHIAYAGEGDSFDTSYALHVQELAREFDAPYEVVLVSGDHMSSIDEAIQHFISEIRMDMER